MTANDKHVEVTGEPPRTVDLTKGGPIPLSDRLALSAEEAGALLGISRDLAYDLVASGELPSVRLGRRIVVPRRALEETLVRMVQRGVVSVVDGPSAGRR